jgi:starch phosphorylase
MPDRVWRLDEPQARRGHDPESIKLGFAGHLKYSLARDRYTATQHDRFIALAMAVRDRLIERWIETQQTHHDQRVKRVYYLSMEFLMGRLMGSNVINLGIDEAAREAMVELGLDLADIREDEVDAGLGNGGLGRLAACFMDSLATLQIPAFGYGLRYDYGIFRQRIENGFQVEEPDDWLRGGNPWELPRTDVRVPVRFGGRVVSYIEHGRMVHKWVDARTVVGIPYDTPIVGYGGSTVLSLRLWSARAAEEFDFQDFNQGDYVAAVESKVAAENLTKVLYPNDNVSAGRELRLKQQYFFVACTLHDIVRRAKKIAKSLEELPKFAAIQLNDTHPALAVPELMRILVDLEGMDWDAAWDATVRTIGYTNHTLLPEALEKWPVEMIERLLPRHLQIIYEINARFLEDVARRFPGDSERVKRMSLIEETPTRNVRMANLCIVGSHSTNGVAKIHTELLRTRLVPDFNGMFPERFNSKTNGITQRRWLLKANPALADLVIEAIGEDWITDLSQIKKLAPLADDPSFRDQFRRAKHHNKILLADYTRGAYGWWPDPDTIFDVQVKRMHEYKRQLLNALHIMVLYNRLRENPNLDVAPRTFLFGGKAAPGYHIAKLIIKLVDSLRHLVNNEPAVRDKIKVFFLPNYRVSLAERVIPAADVSEQISTAGTEASGTGNMKFMLNGALTVGTLDGATIEMRDEVGEENMFLFGLTAEEVESTAPTYDSRRHYESNDQTRAAVDLLTSPALTRGESSVFDDLRNSLLDWGDKYLHLADLPSYIETQDRLQRLYQDREEWTRMAILNVAASGRFSSDRTIQEYADDVWGTKPCEIDKKRRRAHTIRQARVYRR